MAHLRSHGGEFYFWRGKPLHSFVWSLMPQILRTRSRLWHTIREAAGGWEEELFSTQTFEAMVGSLAFKRPFGLSNVQMQDLDNLTSDFVRVLFCSLYFSFWNNRNKIPANPFAFSIGPKTKLTSIWLKHLKQTFAIFRIYLHYERPLLKTLWKPSSAWGLDRNQWSM